MKIILIVIVIILLIANLIPNYMMYKRLKENGEATSRRALMIGIDAILLLLIVVGLYFATK
ncbi:Uncharacterised protein [Staphylococcus piscifermentans]|uniref:Uncharacterized protein n=2 Tax=Staphylococcus TaxID=1279 RepID=A0A239TQQ1_9STAP|nr:MULTISPECIES: hypothetical protein [Staphylococcus]AYU55938.1 hypothetical protein CNQ82_11080 [Staphylococcus debuckii]RTX82503.1 hypothetical protein CD139_10900 [Staphylococcus piscifermentans]GEP85118.1 hypothetical protein SPI02_17030 [Staphylococcus piscifermentans]SNU99872.1 Uncharacterised protein [Staphylococcus piscifermentans]